MARRITGSRKPGRLLIARGRWAARKGERIIHEYDFPSHVARRVKRRHPQLGDAGWALVEQGLREWFICCAWRGRTFLGMPSRAVDDAWHEFLLDSITYTTFCTATFGSYLHHTPDEAMSGGMAEALGNTVRAWDRSKAGATEESVLWDLDERLQIRDPLGVTGLQLSAARSVAAGVASPSAMFGGGSLGDSNDGANGSGCGTGGDGGGCGGGGCGGGG